MDRELRQSERSPDPIEWVFGGALSLGCLAVYLSLRPPLFDYDGYMYRKWAMVPEPWYNANPHHLLWNPCQMVVAKLAYSVGHPSTVLFQIAGIFESCAVLFLFFLWLRKTLDNRSFAAAATAFLAFTPAFWLVTLQNHPYPLALVFLLLYFLCWHPESELPTARRLIAAALCLVASALFHQAVVLLIIPADIVLLVYGRQDLRTRLLRSSLWSGAVFILILGFYVYFWQTIAPDDSLLRWSTSYAEELHPPQILAMRVLPLFARAVAGFSGSLIQTYALKASLADNLTKSQVFTLYTAFGLALLAATVLWLARPGTRHRILSLIRNSPLFALSALTALTWWAFAISWEGATEHYWLLGTVPLLFCFGRIIKEEQWRGLRAFLIGVAIVSGWNLYADHQVDKQASISFPEPALMAIRQHVTGGDVFIVLNGAAHEDADYGLLLDILKMTPPSPAISIADDLIAPANPSKPWQAILKERIASTLRTGHRVYVASHLFKEGEYEDLASEDDPFAEQTNPQFSSIDGRTLYRQVTELLSPYSMKSSDFRIGSDNYLVIEPCSGR